MQTLTEKIIHSNLKNRIFIEPQLKRLLPDSPQSRYGLVHRAMQAGEVQRIRRGVYTLANSLRDTPCHPFAIAQSLHPLSYVSFETALSWHGWIPEVVTETASVVPGRKKSYYEHSSFGAFSFSPLALEKSCFLQGVMRQQLNKQTFLLAEPLRALFDLICQRKLEWSDFSVLTHGLRIDEGLLLSVSNLDCEVLLPVYKHQRTRHFIKKLAERISASGDGL